jgi:hypothetical protein
MHTPAAPILNIEVVVNKHAVQMTTSKPFFKEVIIACSRRILITHENRDPPPTFKMLL